MWTRRRPPGRARHAEPHYLGPLDVVPLQVPLYAMPLYAMPLDVAPLDVVPLDVAPLVSCRPPAYLPMLAGRQPPPGWPPAAATGTRGRTGAGPGRGGRG
jgi:hypothetical protein